MKRVAVIGLDGLPWHILNKLFEWQVMPNLQKLTAQSIRGPLRSTIPPESAPAWTSIATGVNPGKHGIFGFTKPTENYDDSVIMSARDVKYLRVHEMVALQNLKSISINQLLTYPIKRIPGSSVITDWLSPEIKCSPEIQSYSIQYSGPTLGKTSPLLRKDWDSEYAEVSSRVNTVNTLLREVDWNLFWVVYSEPDHLLHRFYDLVLQKDQRLLRLLSKIDETFAVARERAQLLIVVSDHGFRKFRYGVYSNTLLERLGVARKAKRRTMRDISCQRQVAEQKVKLRVPEEFYRYLSALPTPIELVLLKIYKQLVKADIKASLTTHVDPKLSQAFVHGFGIYVKNKDLLNYLVMKLKQEQFIGGVWRREEIYSGRQIDAMPDLVIIPNYERGFALRGDVIAPKTVVRRDFATHHPDGIVIIHKRNQEPSWVKNVKVYDIVPTILDFLALDIPEDTDGKVIPIPA